MADNPQYATEDEFTQLLTRYNKLEKYVQLKIMGNDPSTNWGLLPLIIQQQGPFNSGTGGYTLISGQVLVGAVTTITFSSIPQTFNNLALVVAANSSVGAVSDNVIGAINGDAAANYNQLFMNANSGGVSSGLTNGSLPFIGTISGATAVSNRAGYFIADMPAYALTTFQKVVNTVGSYDAGVSGLQLNQLALVHTSVIATNAITSLILTLQSGGNFKTGSAFYLYGY